MLRISEVRLKAKAGRMVTKLNPKDERVMNMSNYELGIIFGAYMSGANVKSTAHVLNLKPSIVARALIRLEEDTPDFNYLTFCDCGDPACFKMCESVPFNWPFYCIIPRPLENKDLALRRCWAMEHRVWKPSKWRQVVYSGTTRFKLHHRNGKTEPMHFVWEDYYNDYSITVWACFSWHGLGPMVKMRSKISDSSYLNLMADQMLPTMISFFPNCNGIFEDDNMECITNKRSAKWFYAHRKDFEHMMWPQNSSDMNPIESLFAGLEEQIRNLKPPPTNITELFETLLLLYHTIPKETYQAYIDTMPERIAAVIQSGGDRVQAFPYQSRKS